MDGRKGEILTVCAADVSPLKDGDCFALALALASPARREKVLRLSRPEERRRSLAAELLLKKVLRDRALPWKELRYGFGGEGKPCLPELPGFFFSLSHSGDWAMAAGAGAEVGCDVERLREVRPGLAGRYFCPEEAERIASLPGEEGRRLFFRCWTLKESFLKATGQGFRLPLNAVCILPGEEGRAAVRQSVDDRHYFLADRAWPAGYHSAVCAAGPVSGVRWEEADLGKLARELAEG